MYGYLDDGESKCCYIMDYRPHTLEDWLRPAVDGTTVTTKVKQIDFADRIRMARSFLAQIWLMHTKGIVHRDLHPGNIAIFEDSEGSLQLAPMDFGHAGPYKERFAGRLQKIYNLNRV